MGPEEPALTTRPFVPPWWLRGPHVQTLWAAKLRRRPRIATRPERLELPDGDFVDLAWTDDPGGSSPLVAVFHGLEGSIDSPYAAGILKALTAAGMAGVLMHFRSCSGAPNRLQRAYHAGDTGDIRHLLRLLAQRHPGRTLLGVGYSLGANALLCYLSEEADAASLSAAVAVSAPLELSACARRLQHGASRMYQGHLLRQLKRSALAKPQHVDAPLVRSCRTIEEFDDRITAPIHGFGDAETYYARCSSRPRLPQIRIPTLVLHAADDPFMTPEVVPPPGELPADSPVRIELSDRGGHVGFVSGLGRYWLEERIPEFLAGFVVEALPG